MNEILVYLLTQQFSNNNQARWNLGGGIGGEGKSHSSRNRKSPLDGFLAICPSKFLDLPRALSILQLVHHPIMYLLVDKLIII